MSPPTIKNGKKIAGQAQLLLQLDKKTRNEEFIASNIAIGTVGTPSGYIKFSEIKPINAPPTTAPTKKKTGRMLTDPNQEQQERIGQINFIEIEKSHNPEAEGKKLSKNDELMKIIASDWQTLYKFIVDSIVSLGPQDVSKFFRAGVLEKLFSHASEQNICGAFILMNDDPALMALCKEYLPAGIKLKDQTLAVLDTHKNFKTKHPGNLRGT